MRSKFILPFILFYFLTVTVGSSQIISTLAGTGAGGYNGDNIASTSAELNVPCGVAVDASGNVYVAENSNNRIRKIDHITGKISTIAGTGAAGYNGDNILATNAQLNAPTGVCIDLSGNIYIADRLNMRIRKIDNAGIITTVAGDGSLGFSGDNGAATAGQLNWPFGVIVNSVGDIFIADTGNNRIRKVDHSTNKITTIAGTGTQAYNGDNIAATSANISVVKMGLDAAEDLYVADCSNNRIRKITFGTGMITTVAGSGAGGYNGDEIAATIAQLNYPSGVTFDGSGNMYITDMSNQRIRKVDAGSGIIHTIAGNGTAGFVDATAATTGEINGPQDVAINGSCPIYISDQGNQRVRVIRAIAPAFTADHTSVCAGQTVNFTDQSTSGPRIWNWDMPGSTTGTSASQNPSATYNAPGHYDVTLITENACIDTLKKNLYITVNPGPVVHAVSDTICAGQPAQIAAVPVIPGGTYLWTPTGLTDSTISVSPITYTPYTVMYTLAGCNGYDTAKVYVNPTPTIQLSATDSAFCKGNSTTLTATASIPGGTFTWTPAGPNTATNTVSPTTTTLYKVTYTDACATSNTADSLNITVYQLPQAIINSDITSGCVPLCVNFTDASTGVAGTSWNWNFTDSTSTSQNKTHCFKTPGQYDISLKVTTADGCVDSVTNANMITVNALPTADFSAPLTTSLSEPNVSFTDASTGAVTYQWNFGDSLNPATNTSTDPNPTHKYSEVGNYCVTQIVTNASGCSDTTVICLIIDSEFALFIPNSFTPDGNGINDEFYAKGDNIKTFSMLIYDRWGNKIFTSDDITKHWDGKVGGETTIEDTYAYVIDVMDKYSKTHKYVGNISVVK